MVSYCTMCLQGKTVVIISINNLDDVKDILISIVNRQSHADKAEN